MAVPVPQAAFAGQWAASLLGGAQSLYERNTPAVWHGDYTPEQWQEWYSASRRPGADKPKTSIPGYPVNRGYGSMDSSELHKEWLRRAEPRFYELLREWARQSKAYQSYHRDGKGRDILRDVKNIVLGFERQGVEQGPMFARDFLDWLRGTALGGVSSSDNSITPEQLSEWRFGEDGMTIDPNAHYRLTDEGQRQLATLADYNLLTAFQTDPQHRPAALKQAPMSMVGNTIAKVSEPLTWDMSGISGANLDALRQGTPKAAIIATLTQDDYTRERMSSDPNYAKRVWTGAAVPQYSAATPEGMDFTFNSGNTALGNATRYMTNFALQVAPTEPQRQDIFDVQYSTNRITPLRRQLEGSPFTHVYAERDRDLSHQLSNIEANAWRNVSTYLPQQINQMNDTLGTNIKPFYPPAVVNDAFMLVPAMAADPQNLAFAGAGGLLSAFAKSGQRIPRLVNALNRSVSDFPGEFANNTAMTMTNTDQSWSDYITKPDKGVPLRTPGGKTPDPANRQEYEQALADYATQQQNVLKQARDWLNTQRQMPKPLKAKSPKPAVFSGDATFLPP